MSKNSFKKFLPAGTFCVSDLGAGRASPEHGVTMEREKQKALKTQCFQGFLMSMGYKKDIFAVFAYEFELSHKK